MAFETIDDITMDYYDEDGKQKIKQLDKRILTRGSWTTIVFKYQELDREGNYGDFKMSIRRYQKRKGEYKKQSHFNISNKKQAVMLMQSIVGMMFGEKILLDGNMENIDSFLGDSDRAVPVESEAS